MTASDEAAAPQELVAGKFTLEELSDYLAADCQPPRPEIDNHPEARHALAQLRRLHSLTNELVEQETPEIEDTAAWWQAALTGIAGLKSKRGVLCRSRLRSLLPSCLSLRGL